MPRVSSWLAGAGVVAVFLCSILAGPTEAMAQAPAPRIRVGAEFHSLYHYDVSPPLREIAPIPPDWLEHEEHPVGRLPHQHVLSRALPLLDPALQTTPGPLLSATPLLNFDGVGLPSYSPSGAPPDTVGAVGASQYVQWVNTAFGVFDKTNGNRLYGPAAGSTLWQGFGGRCESDNSGDPIVLYDKAAGRWILTQFAVSARPYYQCIAVSTTSDATGTWRRFAYEFADMNDYPKAGVWPDGYYVTYNMFSQSGGNWQFLGPKLCAYDRTRMLSASGIPGPQQCFQLGANYGGLLPADLDGATPPPSGAPSYMMAFDDAGLNGLNLWRFHVDWANAANSTLTGPIKIAGASFTEPCGGTWQCISQPSTTQKLDSLGDRLMYRLAYRNFGTHESLVVNHSVDVSGRTGVRWYEVRSPGGTPVVHQQGTFAPADSNHRWMGSVAMDGGGNLLLGYSVSGTARPSVRLTGRLATDALGTLQTEAEMFAGTGVQTALNRWGDYSAMSVDPVDDCTFWYTTEYLKTTGSFNWSTRVGSYRFSSCGGAPPSPDFSVAASPASVTVTQGTSGTSAISVTSLNGFASAVTLGASGLPSGVTASFSPNPITPASGGSASSTLTLSASASAATGSARLTVTGTSGSLGRSAGVDLVVKAADTGTATWDAALKAPKCASTGSVCDSGPSLLLGRAGLGPEPNQPNTIGGSCADGTAGTFHSDESNDRLRVSTTDGSPFASGKTVKIEATVWAWSDPAADKLDLYYAANATSPSWVFLTTLAPTAAGVNTLSATYTLPAGSLQAVRAAFRYQGAAGACGTGTYDDRDDLAFAVSGGGGGPVTVFYDGAESAQTSFLFSGSTAAQWTRNSTSAAAGAFRWRAADVNGAAYQNYGDARMTTPGLDLTGATKVTLTYAYKFHTEVNYDFFQVRISTNAGQSWTNLVSVSGASPSWDYWAPPASLDLSAWAGRTGVQLQFRLVSDNSVTDWGAAVDEVKVVKE